MRKRYWMREQAKDFATLAKKSTDIISARNMAALYGLAGRVCHGAGTEKRRIKRKGRISGVITKSSVGFLVARLDIIQPAKSETVKRGFATTLPRK